jgi:ATP-dependent RNA helicase DDX31/DBP7
MAKGESDYNNAAETRMQTAVRSQGRLSKKGGVMLSSGSSEFQIAGGSSLERLIHGPPRL